MIYLQCTEKVRRVLGVLPGSLLAAPDAQSLLGNWTVNDVAFGERRAFLFMSDKTLLSFPIMQGRLPFSVADMPTFMSHGLVQLMEMMAAPKDLYASLLKDANEVALTKSGSQSLLAMHKAIAEDYSHRIAKSGGIHKCSLGELILSVNQAPRAKLKWANSMETTLELLRIKAPSPP